MVWVLLIPYLVHKRVKRKEKKRNMKEKEEERGKKILSHVYLDVNENKIKINIYRKLFYYLILVNSKLWINYEDIKSNFLKRQL